MLYRVDLFHEDDGEVVATCRAFPEVVVVAAGEREALREVELALEAAVEARVQRGEPVPKPCTGACHHAVRLPAQMCAKLALLEAVRQSGLTRPELCRRLGCSPQRLSRLLRLDCPTPLHELEAAFRMFGRELHLEVC